MDMDKHPDRIAEQAAGHFARRHGASLSQRRERNAWLQEDGLHAEAYGEIQRVWERAGNLAADPELEALKAADLAAMRRPRWFRPQRMLAIAATLLVVVGAGHLANRFAESPDPVGYATGLGERSMETMPDGTAIVLNTSSKVEVRYSRNLRAVELEQGEAQFEVARDATRPFVVSAGGDTITALGTRFQVHREPDRTIVTLLQGSVAVARGDERYVLRPNERAVMSARTGIAIKAVDPELATGWLDGWLRFRSAPLAEVIAEANRYSSHKLRLGDPRLAGVEVSGNFHAGDNESIAEAASMILPVRVEERGGEIVLMPQ